MTATDTTSSITLPRDSNQALGIGQYACDFMAGRIGTPGDVVAARTTMFFTDSVLCGLSALACRTNAPTILRNEAHEYPRDDGACCLGSTARVSPEKAIAANASAVREWDSNGTNFGYNPELGHVAGEFGHNDFYAVPIAAAQVAGLDGAAALRGMICLDEIRGRLAEVFSLKSYRIDHVVHGAIASAAVYGAMLGATPEQIESAIGMTVAHYVPWRAIRAGHQLSDSKGASAAISTEVAVLSMQRAMRGFVGPGDIFRNPEALWRQFEPTSGDCPFDLVLSHSGDDFAVMGMHFKLGLYEHQSAGALQGLIDLLSANPDLLDNPKMIKRIHITAYEPAFGIIGDPAKRDPRTRQSADHSMVYIVSTMLRKALEHAGDGGVAGENTDDWWKALMLVPEDYGRDALSDATTRRLMDCIEFEHGGDEYDERYPDGIPTSLRIELDDGRHLESGLVMYPAGHARNMTCDLEGLLAHKAGLLGHLAMDEPGPVITRCNSLGDMGSGELLSLLDCPITLRDPID
ncbi:MAG: MmgE/PrpD family protein [Planctomycetota bacterium]|nr:MmgE/PrpD family protein [Planctomycetota bacterium]